MPKMKTNKALAKRLKVSKKGKLLRRQTGSSHLKSTKSNKQLRRFRKTETVKGAYIRKAKRLMGI